MVSLKSLAERIYKSPEAEVYQQIIEHASKCSETTEEMVRALESSREKRYEPAREALGRIIRLEEEADALRRNILERLAVIGIPPSVRQDYVRIAERIDMIADRVKAAARTLLVVGPENLGEDLLDILREEARAASKATSLLVEALEKSRREYDEALATVKEIESVEDRGDELYIHALTLLRKRQDLLVYKLVNDLEGAIDAAEDASDVLEEILVRIIR